MVSYDSMALSLCHRIVALHYWISVLLLSQVPSCYASLPDLCIMKREIGVLFWWEWAESVESVSQKAQESCEWASLTQSYIKPPIVCYP